MEPRRQRWALITGASSGLGTEFARQLARREYNVVLVARRRAELERLAHELEQTAGIRTHVMVVDLAGAGAVEQLARALDDARIEIDVLVNNAGYGLFGPMLDRAWPETEAMLRLNMTALAELTYVMARQMRARRSGHILLVASIGAFQATPTYAAYSATKAFVLLLGEALHEELREAGVVVTVTAPGVTATEFLAVSGQKPTFYQRWVMMTAPDVVTRSLHALFAARALVVPGWINAFTVWTNRWLPRWAQRKVANRLMRN